MLHAATDNGEDMPWQADGECELRVVCGTAAGECMVAWHAVGACRVAMGNGL